MDCSQLSNEQLYALVNNKNLAKDIADIAKKELDDRNISPKEKQDMLFNYNQLFKTEDKPGIKDYFRLWNKNSSLFTPSGSRFFMLGHFFSELQKKSTKQKRRSIFRLYAACFVLTAIILLLAKYHLFNRPN